jgi:hypothetical protein
LGRVHAEWRTPWDAFGSGLHFSREEEFHGASRAIVDGSFSPSFGVIRGYFWGYFWGELLG